MWFTLAQDVKRDVSVFESSEWIFQMGTSLLHGFERQHDRKLGLALVCSCLCEFVCSGWYAKEEHLGRWTTVLGYDTFTCYTFCVGLMLLCGCCKALEIHFQYFQSVVASACFAVSSINVWCKTKRRNTNYGLRCLSSSTQLRMMMCFLQWKKSNIAALSHESICIIFCFWVKPVITLWVKYLMIVKAKWEKVSSCVLVTC